MSAPVTNHAPEGRTTEGVPRCLRCDYNLTGLPEPRCPECGTTFDWAAVWKAATNPPRIAFERARGWRKVPGFVVTWATVLFAPWIFARQAVHKMSVRHALAFVGVCFAGTLFAAISSAEGGYIVAWLGAAAAYIVLQAIGLSLVDVSGWGAWRASLRFWLLVGCYTSAIMLTEVVWGAPMLLYSDVHACLAGGRPDSWTDEIFSGSLEAVTWWLQIALWLLGVACCYFARLRRLRWSRGLCLCASLVLVAGLILLYSAAYEHVGGRVYVWFD